MIRFLKNYTKLAITATLLILISMTNFATTYYVSNAGNDSNNGTSTSTPWKTLAKVRGTKFSAGDNILLKSGDIFNEAFGLLVSGSIENRIKISSYGGSVKPEIRGYGEVPDWTYSNVWSLYATGIYQMSLSIEPNRLWINGKDRKESRTIALTADFMWRWEGGFLYIKSPENPSTYFNSIHWSMTNNSTAQIIGISNVIFMNLKISGGGTNSFALVNCKNITIDSCEIGYRANVYGISAYSINNDSTDNLIIKNNTFLTGDSLYYTYFRVPHSTFEAVLLGNGVVNSKVYNNYMNGWAHCGVSLNAGNVSYPLHDIEVYNNYITAPLIDYARGLGCDYSRGHSISFHHNTVYKTSVHNQFNGDGLKVYDNIFDGIKGCPYPEKPKVGIGIAISGYANNATNMEIYNNTITNCANTGLFITWYGNATQKAFNNIHDNNIFNNDTVSHYQLWIDTNDPVVSINHNTYSNNHFFKANKTDLIYTRTGIKSLNSFNGSTPCVGDVVSDNDNLLTYNVFGYGKYVVTINDLKIEYNGTGLTKTVNLDFPMLDIYGKKYARSIILQPYTSVILLKDYSIKAILNIEYKSICEGNTYLGWSTTGKYERTLVSKSGGDSIVTTFLTINPKYAVTEDITIDEGQNYYNWTKSGQYIRNLNSVSGCDSTVTTNLTVAINSTKQGETVYTQMIQLKKGNNLVSTYVSVSDPLVSSVSKNLTDAGSLLKIQDEAGNSFENCVGLGGWINNVGSIQKTEGYKITVNTDCIIQVSGITVALPLDIPLISGWNIISFPRADAIDALSVIQTLIDQDKLIKVQDEQGNSIENWGMFGGWINGIGNFIPGKAYKVKMNGNAFLTYQQNYTKSSNVFTGKEKTEFFIPCFEGNGTDHININLVGLRESGLVAGDELAAFDGERCVGALKIIENNLLTGTASLISSHSTNDQNQDGFQEGDPVRIYAWNKLTGKKTEVQAELINGNFLFARNASVILRMKSLTTDISPLSNEIISVVFPNPCQGRFTVRFNELPDRDSRIEVLDSLGRLITTRQISANSEVFSLVSSASGLYFVKIFIGSKQNIHKLIIN